MIAIRWTLLLLAALAGVAGVIYATREPAESPPASPRGPRAAALPLNLPASAPASPIEAGAASAGAPRAMPPPLAAPAAAKPRIGSEGYGPHIERAQAGNDARAAWEAVQWLRNCMSNQAGRDSLERARAQGVVPELMTQLMVEADAEARRCQTVTAPHRALLPELASRAMRAGVPEAASAYAAAAFARDLTAAQRQEVADAMRRDALAGHAQSLLGASLSHPEWGLSDAEKLAFIHGYAALPDQPGAQAILQSLLASGALGLKAAPTPVQLAAAREAGQQITARAAAARP